MPPPSLPPQLPPPLLPLLQPPPPLPQEPLRPLRTIDDDAPHATAGQALLRVLTGLPSALVLMMLCWIGLLVWLWATLSILIAERMPAGAFTCLVGLQRWSVRLLAYQACLVDAYPPFSLFEPRLATPPAVVL